MVLKYSWDLALSKNFGASSERIRKSAKFFYDSGLEEISERIIKYHSCKTSHF